MVAKERARSCDDSFRSIADDCAQALGAALTIVLETDDPVGPHRARVALRRLTTALDAFAPILRRRAAAELRSNAKRMFRCLGAIRDSDVHLQRDGVSSRRLRASNRALRKWARTKLRKHRLVGFMQRLQLMIQADSTLFRRSKKALGQCRAPVRDLATRALASAWGACAGYGTSVQGIPVVMRHEFRKDVKSLRYLAEFFTTEFPELREEPFLTGLREVQDAVGDWNDHVVGLRIEGRKSPERLPGRVAEALATAEKRWTELLAIPLAWEAESASLPIRCA